jgi:hypothetical protein
MNRNTIPLRMGIYILAVAVSLAFVSACNTKQQKAKKAVETFLQSKGNRDIREMSVDLFHPSDNTPSKAYIGVTVTYNFAGGSGSLQKERLAFVLNQDGSDYTVERPVSYNTDAETIEAMIAGKSGKPSPTPNPPPAPSNP